ncbi:unnamed protein product [Mytilus coruscus]|uniref:DUF7869 domain-containing protein n=1 Tax=Mytilus coruscus TaxID=42192 RepID=A0A6J8BMC4_MYTCO|nr:unnamed protein product [Mytilus coruscus]
MVTPSTSNFHFHGHAEESNRNSIGVPEKKSSEIHIKRNHQKRRDNTETKLTNVQKTDKTHRQRTNNTKIFLCCPEDTSEQGEKFTKDKFSKLMLDISNMHLDILNYIQNCPNNIKSMPKLGDPLDSCEDYNDETRNLTEEQRSSLTKYLCDNFQQITFQHPDVPSLIYGTITFILTHRPCRPSDSESGQVFDLTQLLEADDNDDTDSGKIENDGLSNVPLINDSIDENNADDTDDNDEDDSLHAVAFMDNFIDEYGDPSPERDAYLSFLLKGHTHEDIDQRFSVISQRLRRVNAMTLLQLQKEIESSFHDKLHQETRWCASNMFYMTLTGTSAMSCKVCQQLESCIGNETPIQIGSSGRGLEYMRLINV